MGTRLCIYPKMAVFVAATTSILACESKNKYASHTTKSLQEIDSVICRGTSYKPTVGSGLQLVCHIMGLTAI